MTNKPVALEFRIELEFRSVFFLFLRKRNLEVFLRNRKGEKWGTHNTLTSVNCAFVSEPENNWNKIYSARKCILHKTKLTENTANIVKSNHVALQRVAWCDILSSLLPQKEWKKRYELLSYIEIREQRCYGWSHQNESR